MRCLEFTERNCHPGFNSLVEVTTASNHVPRDMSANKGDFTVMVISISDEILFVMLLDNNHSGFKTKRTLTGDNPDDHMLQSLPCRQM